MCSPEDSAQVSEQSQAHVELGKEQSLGQRTTRTYKTKVDLTIPGTFPGRFCFCLVITEFLVCEGVKSLGTELTLVSCHDGAGNLTQVPWKSSKYS